MGNERTRNAMGGRLVVSKGWVDEKCSERLSSLREEDLVRLEVRVKEKAKASRVSRAHDADKSMSVWMDEPASKQTNVQSVQYQCFVSQPPRPNRPHRFVFVLVVACRRVAPIQAPLH